MNYKYLFLIVFIFLFSCESKTSKIQFSKNFELYSNKGFALIYNDDLFKKKIVNKKINERSLIIFSNNLNIDTPVKVTNLINGKYLIAKVGKKSEFPNFYNSVISKRIATDLNVDFSEPYVQIQTINFKNTFIANKAKTFDEERNVADKAPVDSISIQNISINQNEKENEKEKVKKVKKFKYIIKFADLYFEDSAKMLKDRLINEFKIKNVSIKKMSNNNFRVYKGPFNNLESIKNAFKNIKNLDFENIEVIKL